MEIRRLQENDHELLASAIELLIPEEDRCGKAEGEARRKQTLERRDCYFIVCLVDSTPVGYLSAYRFPEVESAEFFVYLFDIIVDERFRRKGIGSRMIEELKKQCREDQVASIEVGTSVENEAAQRTYEGTGARKVETCVSYLYELDEDA